MTQEQRCPHILLIGQGTQKRTGEKLAQELSSLGMKLDGQTTREQTAFYIKCLTSDVAKAVEILADVVLNPKLDQQVRRDVSSSCSRARKNQINAGH